MVKDVWGDRLKILPNPNTYDFMDDVVPITMEEMMRWACVSRDRGNKDRKQRYALVYIFPCSDSGVEPRMRVSIKLQGFVDRLNLSLGGNWTG